MKVFDIEALNWNNIYAIGIYDGKDVNILTSPVLKNNSFIKWLLDNLADGDIVYAHNGGKYDFLFIFDFIKSVEGKLLSIKVINASVVMFRVEYDKKRIEFRDSYAILPSSLKSLTNDFNVKHKKLEMDYTKGLKDTNFYNYFKNDLIGLYEVLEQSRELTEKLTLASNSMNIFLTDFYQKEYYNNSIAIDDIFRLGYMGGRVEIFKMRGTDLHYYDINSLYPSVMKENEYPLIENKNYRYVNRFYPDVLGYYYCNIESPDMHIPLLPYRTAKGKLIFPVGKWQGWYYSPEILKARELGYDISIRKGYVFEDTGYIFRDFVNHYYNIKSHSTGAKKAIAKLVLNSLYGKFGQRHVFDEFIIDDDEKARYNYIPSLNLSRRKRISYSKYQHTEIAGLITSYARLKLYSLFEKAGMDSVYYCDTDSIITSSLMKTSSALGDIKEEADIEEFIALSPKVYAYTESNKEKVVIKAKGLDSKRLSFADFQNAITYGNYSNFINEYEKVASFKLFNTRHLSNFSDKLRTIRRMKSIYDKREILKNFDTKPLIIG